MSHGLALITSIIESADRRAFRELRDEHFAPAERPAWEFLRDYYSRHGALPTPGVFSEAGIALHPASGVPSYHMQVVRTRCIYNAIQDSQSAINDALQRLDMDLAVEAANEMQERVARIRATEDVQERAQWVDAVMQQYNDARNSPSQDGITLGWRALDVATGGILPGDVCAVVGRPGDGKSYTLAHMARAAWRAGKNVLFITNEMTSLQMSTRLVALESGVDTRYIRTGQVGEHVIRNFRGAVATLRGEGAQFHMVGGGFRQSVRKVDALVQELRPDVVYIDASYLMRSEGGPKNRSRWELLADVGEGIKELALSRDVPIVHSVQFNRQQKSKGKSKTTDLDHGMDLDNIGGTDVIAQVATIVIGLRQGAPPNERTTRRYSVMKNREGGLLKFSINYLFAPINFDLLSVDTSDDSAREEAARQQAQNLAARESHL